MMTSMAGEGDTGSDGEVNETSFISVSLVVDFLDFVERPGEFDVSAADLGERFPGERFELVDLGGKGNPPSSSVSALGMCCSASGGGSGGSSFFSVTRSWSASMGCTASVMLVSFRSQVTGESSVSSLVTILFVNRADTPLKYLGYGCGKQAQLSISLEWLDGKLWGSGACT